MTIAELIDALKRSGNEYVRIAAPTYSTPTGVSSYRGYYEQLALTFENEPDKDMPRKEMIEILEVALANREGFCGWKGGHYCMAPDTEVWVSNDGDASGMRVTRVSEEGYAAMIHVEYQP